MISKTTMLMACLVFPAVTVSEFQLFAQESVTQEAVRLEWKWNKGDRFGMEIVQDVTTDLQMEDAEEKTKTTVENQNITSTWLSWEVMDADSTGVGTITSTVDRISMERQGPEGKLRFDSNQPSDDPQVQAMAGNVEPMVGARTTQKISKWGEVLMVRVGTDLEAKLSRIGGEAYVKTFKDLSRNATLVLPEQGLKVQDSWTKEVETASPMGNIKLRSTYTYQGEVDENGRRLHLFEVQAEMSFANAAASVAVTIDDQQTEGRIYFDAESGRIDHSEMTQSIRISMSQNQREATQTMKQVTRVRITRE